MIPKGYKKTEIGIIPKDWEINRIIDISNKIGDGIHTTPNYISYSKYYFINGNNISKYGVEIKNDTKCISFDEYNRLKQNLKPKTILISINGTIGNIAYYNNEPVILGKSVGYIELKSYIIKKYITYVLSSNYIINYFKNELTGSTISNLSLESLKNTPILLPPLPEQKAIADVLSDMDNLIFSLEKLIAKKKLIKQGAMQELLTGKKRLPGFKGEWKKHKLEEYVECIRGVSYDGNCDLFKSESDQTIRLLRSNNIQDSNFVLNDVQYINRTIIKSSQILQQFDIMVCMANGSKMLVGKNCLFKNELNSRYSFGAFMGVIRRRNSSINIDYIFYLMNTRQYWENIQNLLSGSSINNLSPDNITGMIFNFPSQIEQKAIADILSNMDNEIEALEKKLSKYQKIKQGMMHQLLTGKIRLI